MLSGCMATQGGVPVTDASKRANAAADQTLYQAIEYKNKAQKGPTVIVLPGKIKSNNATFSQKVSSNNIADFAELELSRANFRVLERSDLGPMLSEIELAVNMGDPQALKRFRRGKFRSTQWFIKFDILKAEQVAKSGVEFDGRTISNLLGRATGNYYLATATRSLQQSENAGIWIIGMHYKVMDARSSEIVTQGYFEDKMEVGSQSIKILGISQSQSGGVTLDSMVQRLVQQAVADLDKKKGPPKKSKSMKSKYAYRMKIKSYQTLLNKLGYNCGKPDGLPGAKTRSALAAFQNDYGLKITKKFDTTTVQKLKELQ